MGLHPIPHVLFVGVAYCVSGSCLVLAAHQPSQLGLASRALPEFTNHQVATCIRPAVRAAEDLEALCFEKVSCEQHEVIAPRSSIRHGNLGEIKSWHS